MSWRMKRYASGLLVFFLLWMQLAPGPAVARASLGNEGQQGTVGGGKISSGGEHSLAIRPDGTVVAWGNNDAGQATPPLGLQYVKDVAAGGSHSLALLANGEVIAWGENSDDQATVPSGLAGVVAIAAGGSHSLALKANGEVVAWGNDGDGQATVPVGLAGVIAIAAGADHSLALRSDGTVVGWGADDNGQSSGAIGVNEIAAIAAGDGFSLALTSSGDVVAWGRNDAGQTTPPTLGNVAAIAAGGDHAIALLPDGTVVAWGGNGANQSTPPLGLNRVVGIAAGGQHSLAVRTDGSIVGWGSDVDGQSTAPANIALPVKTKEIFGGLDHTLALKTDGTVVAWGTNGNGQTNVPAGLANVAAVAAGRYHSVALRSDGTVAVWGHSMTTSIPALNDVVDVEANGWFTLALQADGKVKAWGQSTLGQTNVPSTLDGVVDIAAGTYHALAVRSDGTVVGWGNDSDGQVSGAASVSGAVAVAAGNVHSMALTADGAVVAWGDSSNTFNYGQTNVPPEAQSGVIAIAAGEWHSLALKADGTVVGWGNNDFGQSVPPAGLTNVVAISAGYGHSVALKADGTVVTWGDNTRGQRNVQGNNSLGNLTISAGALNPSFQSSVTSYEFAYVDASAASVDITATLADAAHTSLLIDGLTHPNGATVPVDLDPGTTTVIPIRVEPHFLPGRTYTVTVQRDATPPSVVFGTNGSESFASAAATSVTIADAQAGVDAATLEYAWSASTVVPAGSWAPFNSGDPITLSGANGDRYLHVRAEDALGNAVAAVSNRFRLDNTAPLIDIVMETADGNAYPDGGWTNQSVVVTASASDVNGVASLSYSTDSGATWHPYTTGIQFDSDGAYIIQFRAFDAAGNTGEEQRTVNISRTGLRLTPTLMKADGSVFASGEWTNQSVTASVYAEAGDSGIASLTYTLDGGASDPYVNETPILISDEGNHTLAFNVADHAGNSLPLSLAVNIDRTPPSISFDTNGSESWSLTASTVVTAADTGSGVDGTALAYAWSDSTVSPSTGWTPFANGAGIPISSVDGDRYLHVRASDKAGNAASAVSNRFRMDDSNAELAGLALSSGTLQPAFAPAAENYTVVVGNGVDAVTVSPVALDDTDTVTVARQGGTPEIVPGGGASGTIDLNVGVNTIEVHVAALNGTTKTYVVTINRAAPSPAASVTERSSNANLRSLQVWSDGRKLELTPAFRWDVKEYRAETAAAEANIRPLVDDVRAVVAVNGTAATDEFPASFEVGDNRFVIEVKAEDGTAKTYTLTLVRTAMAQDVCPFMDVSGHWAAAEACEAWEEGIVFGESSTTFEPDRYVTRAEFIAMLLRALRMSEDPDAPDPGFADAGDIPGWAKGTVATAASRGIVRGDSAGMFGPDRYATRTELATMLARSLDLTDDGNAVGVFADEADIPAWGKPYVNAVRRNKIMIGYDNRFWPSSYVTRAQAAVALLQLRSSLDVTE